MIVYVEGPDGSGKSTIVSDLRQRLIAHQVTTEIGPPLWEFLNAINAPQEFGDWVQRASQLEVAVALMNAMSRRALEIVTAGQPHRVLLIDRGPQTVVCSARAHADCYAMEVAFTNALDALLKSLNKASQTELCISVELRPPSAELILERLSYLESLNMRYDHYLRRFCQEMAGAKPVVASPQLALSAGNSAELNALRAMNWILKNLKSATSIT